MTPTPEQPTMSSVKSRGSEAMTCDVLWRRGLPVLTVALACSIGFPAAAAQVPERLETVFVIVLENASWSDVKSNPDAPYLNGELLPRSSHAEAYKGPLNGTLHPSLPNYIWLEAGDNLGIRDDAPPASHHLDTPMHLVTLLEHAGVSWRTYQQGIAGDRCPLAARGEYQPKHNPMIYFNDVTDGNDPRSKHCIDHVRPLTELRDDLENSAVARYNFIIPDQCNDMHSDCAPRHNRIKQGDDWLRKWMPRLLASTAYKRNGAVFITWDEAWFSPLSCPRSDCPIGMIVLSPLAKGGGYTNNIPYDHSSTLKTLEELFGVTPLLRAAGDPVTRDLRDMFSVFP
jgi:phospholipase C